MWNDIYSMNDFLTHNEKYRVASIVPRYAEVNGRRGTENKCFMWFIGPHRKEKLKKKLSLIWCTKYMS
jgi:hypothetical protein